MNLQEEMQDVIFKSYDMKITVPDAAKSCAEIAESNAIEFGVWIGINCTKVGHDFIYNYDDFRTRRTAKELYTIFKSIDNGEI